MLRDRTDDRKAASRATSRVVMLGRTVSASGRNCNGYNRYRSLGRVRNSVAAGGNQEGAGPLRLYQSNTRLGGQREEPV